MTEDDANSISQDILSLTRERNTQALKQKNLGAVEKLIIQNQDVILMFIEKDHAKTIEMWAWYKAQKNQVQRWEPRLWQILFVVISWVIVYYLSKL